MRIATWNVNSVRAREPRLLPWLEAERPDVVCLQETKCVDEAFPREPVEELGYNVELFGQKTYNGVAILSREPMSDVRRGMPGEEEDADRRVVAATIGDLTVVNVYVVNGKEVGSPHYEHKLRWLGRLRDYLAEEFDLSQPFVMCGDFNVTFDDRDVWDPELWREKILCSTKEREALGAIVDLGLHDAFRKFHEDGGHHTWWDYRMLGFAKKRGLRIDHFLVSDVVLDRSTGAEVDLDARRGKKPSDHAPVVLTLESDHQG
ncbi:MAG: exodeoxyribonuclease III [Planctomycetota bacterium JB042]